MKCTSLDEYTYAWRRKRDIWVRGLLGRVLHGNNASDFRFLANETDRRLVMAVDGQGLRRFLTDVSVRHVLDVLGYSKECVEFLMSRGEYFKLLVFPKLGQHYWPATWNGLMEAVSMVYHDCPGFVYALGTHLGELKVTPFAWFEHETGWSWEEVYLKGPSDQHFMTLGRFLDSARGLVETRRLLYNCLHLNGAFTGTGKTRTESPAESHEAVRELFVPNSPVAGIVPHELLLL